MRPTARSPTARAGRWPGSRWAACRRSRPRSGTWTCSRTSAASAAGGGGFGGAPFDPKTAHGGVMADADAFNGKVRLLWLGIGTAEPQRMYESVKNYHEALEKAGIKHVYYESPGTSHEWQTWRPSLHEFAPLLFQSASQVAARQE